MLIDPRDNHSDFIVYVDESGDHGLKKLDPSYPVFVLSFCIFNKTQYAELVVPAVQKLKFKWWGHDGAILHTIDIKRQQGDFSLLGSKPFYEAFMEDLNLLIEEVPFTLIAAVIHKDQLLAKSDTPNNPYNIALLSCMERTYQFLEQQQQEGQRTTLMVEERGRNEDRDLELEFRRIRDGDVGGVPMRMFEFRSCSKKVNSSGLQIADLVSTPLGRVELNPERKNRAYEVIARKLYRSSEGEIEGWGKKVFP